MPTESNITIKMKVFSKGQVVIPAALRKKYKIAIGDQLDIIQDSAGILLIPTKNSQSRGSLTDRLFGTFSEHARKKPALRNKDITKATETGFTKGWSQ